MPEKMPLSSAEPSSGAERFQSDTQKIVRKHLENKDHVITDDDIRNVRVGMTPPADSERHLDDILNEEKSSDESPAQEKPADDPITPWDTVEH